MNAVTPLSLKNAPALIEELLPVQKLSAEAYKEQMAGERQDADRARQLLEGPQTTHPKQSVHPRLPATSHERPPRATSKSSKSSWLWTMNHLSPAGRADPSPEKFSPP